MTLLEDDFETRLRDSGLAVRSAFADGPPVPLGDLQSARRRRTSIRSLALVLILAGVGVFGWRSGSTQDLTATPTGVNEVEVDSVFGNDLGTDDVIWPAQPLPLDELLDTFTTEVLAWPSAEWNDPVFNSVPGNSAWFVSLRHPVIEERNVFLALEKSADEWAIQGFAYSNDLVLETGQLVGLRANLRLRDSTGIEAVEVFRSSAEGHFRSAHAWPAEGNELRFSEPLEPSEVGSVLVIARDGNGEAVNVSGFAAGFPDRLTVDLGSLGPGKERSQFDESAMLAGGFSDFGVGPLYYHLFPDVVPGVSVSLGQPADGSGLCFLIKPATTAAGSCVRSLRFNQHGAMVAHGSKDFGSAVLIVIPDAIEFGDVGDAVVHESGRFLVLVDANIGQVDYEVTDGVLNFTS